MEKGIVAFIQGPPSPFWPELAASFRSVGWRVEKIHLGPSDHIFWDDSAAMRFSGDLGDWEAFFECFVRSRGVEVVCLYSDGLPHHRRAVQICKKLGVRAYVFENGYLRPDWITCQEGGMYEGRALPRDPEEIRRIAQGAEAPDLEIEYKHRFIDEAWREVLFHLSNGLTPQRVWRFDHDRYYHPVSDYASWVRRIAFAPAANQHALAVSKRLIFNELPYYFVPLQLQSDYSVRLGSPYDHISEMMRQVMTSFAAHAPKRCSLLFKIHPHDNGRERWRKVARRMARELGLEKRVRVIGGGPFGALLSSSRGVVVINSTSGLHAIRALKPTIALGRAVYDAPGLTHQNGLDRFWRDPDPVDSFLVRDFVRALAARTQIKGSFFQKEGRQAACRAALLRIVGETAPETKAGVQGAFAGYMGSEMGAEVPA